MKKIVKTLTALILLLSISAQSISQNKDLAQEFITQAEEVMKATRALEVARDLYLQALQFDQENIIANYKVGEIYLKSLQKHKATAYLMKVAELDVDYKFNLFYMIGKSLQYGLEFDQAIDYYEKYAKLLDTNAGYEGPDMVPIGEVQRKIYECQNGKEFVRDQSEIEIVNMGSRINSVFEDYAPVLNPEETELVFTSRRKEGNTNVNVDIDNKPFEDVFVSVKNGDKWSHAKNVGNVINTEYHDSNIAFSPDAVQLFLYSDMNNGDIYVTNRDANGSWSDPQELDSRINSEFAEKSITKSADGKLVIFSSNRPSGPGGMDLYFSKQNKKGKWSKPTVFKSPINTEYNEDSPFLDYDGKTLYFSSSGGKGMGGFDIFKTVYDSTSNRWSEPENLGYPINTPDNDIALVKSKDGKRAYYSSVREDGIGYTDIYIIKLEPDLTEEAEIANTNVEEEKVAEITPVKETATDEQIAPEPTLQPVKITIEIKDAGTGQLTVANVAMQTKDGKAHYPSMISAGIYQFEFQDPQPFSATLNVSKESYMYYDASIEVPAAGVETTFLERAITLKKLQVGSRKVIRNVYFESNGFSLVEESFVELSRLEKLLVENPGVKVEIAGYTDNVGSRNYNQNLSNKRASEIMAYLISRSIAGNRIVAMGYGEGNPLASNDDEKDGRELNRRVEFKVIDMDEINAGDAVSDRRQQRTDLKN